METSSPSFAYRDAPVPVRAELQAAHRRAFLHLAAPGTWWTGAERVAIAAEARQAESCGLCAQRALALSPSAVRGEHDRSAAGRGALPDAAIEAVHRIVRDAARLTRGCYEELRAQGLTPEHYVELLGVVTLLLSVDDCHRGLGVPLEPLPEPQPGEPSRLRPEHAAAAEAWVPMLTSDGLARAEPGLFGGRARLPNVVRALSLVPAQVRAWTELSEAQYVPGRRFFDTGFVRGLDRAQIELVAARVSALNRCFY